MARNPGAKEDARPDSAPAGKPAGNGNEPERRALGKYQIVKKIGAGGMGIVYLATDTQLKRTVALKILSKDKAENRTLVQRFQAEAQAAAQLRDENIVLVYEAGEIDGYSYIALEYVDGIDVHELVNRKGVLPVRRSIEIIKQVAKALKHASERNIVHRDIKPSNLLIRRDGMVKLADLGLARSIDDATETGITRAGTTVGTVDYMSPEQARNSKAADVRSDIYSLGCTWYHMLTGMPPFSVGSLTTKLYHHASKDRPDPREKNDAVPEGVVSIMHRMMERNPKDRYQTAEQLIDALNHVDSLGDSASPAYLAAISEAVSKEDAKPEKAESPAQRKPPKGPPPRRPSKEQLESEPKGGFDTDILKYAAAVALGVGFLAFLGWLAVRFSATFDSPGNATDNPFANANAASGPDGKNEPAKEFIAARNEKKAKDKNEAEGEEAAKKKTKKPSVEEQRPHDDDVLVVRPVTTKPADLQKIKIGRPDEREFMPGWVGDVEEAEAAAVAEPEGPQHLTVGRAAGGPAKYAKLMDALAALPPTGGTVELAGDGPYIVRPIQLEGRERIVLTAAKGSQPLVVFLPEESTSGAVLSVAGGSLVIDGLHLAVLAKAATNSNPLTLVEVRSGDLAVRNSSVTLEGSRQSRTTAFRVSGVVKRDDIKSRVLLDRVFVRGDNLTALEADTSATDLLANNCLFATGAAPVVTMTNLSEPFEDPAAGKKPDAGLARTVRLQSCTVLAEQNAFEFSAGVDAGAPPPTLVHSLNSVFAGKSPNRQAVVLLLTDWPKNNTQEPGRALVSNLRWRSDSSLFVGWDDYIRMQPQNEIPVNGAEGWRRFWGHSDQDYQFILTGGWPANRVQDFARLTPQQLDATKSGLAVESFKAGSYPGCQVAALSIPRATMLERADAIVERPSVPSILSGESAPTPVVVDIQSGSDLGRKIKELNAPSETLFIVKGGGTKRSSQIRIEGKSYRFRFEQVGNEPLEIEPLRISDTTPDDGSGALFYVKDGQVQIENGNFKLEYSAQKSNVSQFLFVENGSFALRDTVVKGPHSEAAGYDALIRWRGVDQGGGNVVGDAGSLYNAYGVIENCYLSGIESIVKATLHKNALIVHDSVLAGMNGVFDLDVFDQGGRVAAAVYLDHTTLSASDQYFNVQRRSATAAVTQPLRLYAWSSVFAAAPTTAKPAILKAEESARTQNLLTWWEAENGYASEVASLFAGKEGASAAEWQQAWGADHVLRPLFGKDVLLQSSLPEASSLEPANFALSTSSGAATWSSDGTAIGADVEALKEAGQVTSTPAPAAGKTATPKRSTRKKPPRL